MAKKSARFELHRYSLVLAAAVDLQLHRLAGSGAADDFLQFRHACDSSAVDTHDNVLGLQARELRGAAVH